MEEYFKRKKEGHSTEERSTALNNSSTALSAVTNSDSNSYEHWSEGSKEGASLKAEDEPSVRGSKFN